MLNCDDNGAVARVIRAAVLTRDRLLEMADAQRFDDETFHALQTEACAWQLFAEALVGPAHEAEILQLRGFV